MPGLLDSCVNNVYEDGNIPASSGETPTRVLLKEPLEAEILEAAAAADALDGFVGEVISEAASATDTVNWTAGAMAVDVAEAATATATQDGTVTAAPSEDWTLVDTWTASGAVAQVDFTGLAAYTEIRVLVRDVSATAGSGIRQLRVSTDNGSTFLSTSGDYVEVVADGTETNSTSIPFGSSVVASGIIRSGEIMISGWNSTTGKSAETRNRTDIHCYIIPTTSALNALRINNSSGGNLTAGSIDIFAR